LRKDDFKEWLKNNGANSENGRNTRAYAIQKIEGAMAQLGSPHADLEAAWEDDGFEQLRARLQELKSDANSGGDEYRILMPDSENPTGRLSNWRSWLSQYGRFISQTKSPEGVIADRIREFVLENYITPGREAGKRQVEILVKDVNERMKLNQNWPNICQVLEGSKFLKLAQVAAPERLGARQSPATTYRFDLVQTDRPSKRQEFILMSSSGEKFQPVRNYNGSTGVSAFRVKPKGASNEAGDALQYDEIVDVARAMLIDGLAARIKAIAGGPVNYLTYGGSKLVAYELDPEIAEAIGVPARGSKGIVAPSTRTTADRDTSEESYEMPPTNLILYGPPGTGKTYQTAAEALRLCQEPVPASREELMEAYHRLRAANRIEFVTFHQSMSYEEFIEGRQPTTEGTQEGSGTGFRLETVPGIFRRIAARTQKGTPPKLGENALSLEGRHVFKMSIARADAAAENYLFEEAMNEGHTLLGWEDIDFTDEKFSDIEQILQACRDEGERGGEVSLSSGQVAQMDTFRNQMEIGDIIVVTKGNSLFRAIGEITGDYEYRQRENRKYCHRRSVRWLWVDRSGVPASEIYDGNFTMRSIYQLDQARLDVAALESYMNGESGLISRQAKPHVLIIDEINRANISKVFGELITLIEPDKRLGMPNALTVRLPYSGEEFGVPANLHILGTMNTADRSIALLDTALRRRFEFREMLPQPEALRDAARDSGLNLPRILGLINERIEYLYDREHQIGHAYFINCGSREEVDAVMRHKVIPLLAEYFFEDWSKVAAVLGDASSDEQTLHGGFMIRDVLDVPPGMGDGDGAPRYRWSLRDGGFNYSGLGGE
jgi:5-methylcytosine-specific restriction protein B